MLYTISDIKAIMDLGNLGAELQTLRQLYFDKRSLLYPFTTFVNSYYTKKNDKTNPYSRLRPIYALNILGYNNFKEDKDALRIFNLYDIKRNKKFTNIPDMLNLAYFELKKPNIETENQKHWRDYFLGNEISKNAPQYIKEAEFVVDKINMNEEEIEMLTLAEKLEADYMATMEYATLEGVEIGVKKGRQEGRQETMEIINNLIKQGYSPEEAIKKAMSEF